MSKITIFGLFVLLLPLNVENASVNVGTVLFTQSDMHRSCWTMESIALLTTRMILEDLMPPIESINIDSNDYVSDLMSYFREIMSVVRQQCKGKRKHIILLALTDILGGYLKTVVLPRAKHAYYAGLIEFSSMERLLQLYEELKWFLRTNGLGWAKSNEYGTGEAKVTPLNMDIVEAKASCDALIYYQKPHSGKLKCKSKQKDTTDKQKEPNYVFPVPFFDTKIHPSAIAIPFKSHSLRNIESKKSENLITKFFISVYSCMAEKSIDIYSRQKFYNEFFTWIERDATPKMDDEKFYSALGGILRVEQTLKSFGAQIVEISTTTVKFDEEGLNEIASQSSGSPLMNSSMILLAVLIAIFVWFLLGILFICYRIRAKKKGSYHCTCSGPSSDKSKTNTTTTTTTSSTTPMSTESTDSRTYGKCTCVSYSSKSATPTESKSKSTSRSAKDYSYIQEPPVATIETMQSLKLLPSIAEISEKSSREDKIFDSTCTTASSTYSTDSADENINKDPVIAAYSKLPHEMYLEAMKKGHTVVQRMPPTASVAKKHSADSFATGIDPSCPVGTGSKKKESYSSESSSSEDISSKPHRSPAASISSCLKNENNVKESSDFSTDATSQVLKLSAERPRKKHNEESTSGSSDVNPSEFRRIISANVSHHDEVPTTETTDDTHKQKSNYSHVCQSTPTGKYTSETPTKPPEKKFIFGYDFHTSSSGDSSAESEESGSEVRTSSSK